MTSNDADERAQPDPELLERARAGDREALAELLRHIHPLVLRWARVRFRDPADAEDLAQDVLVRVIRSLGTFRGESRFTSWLWRVVGSTAADRGRRTRRREERREELEMRREPGPAADPPDGDVDRERLLGRVRECFYGLTDRQREIFELCELRGLDSAQAGEVLGIAPATVRVTLLRVRRSMREEILKTDPELVEAYFS